MDLNGKGSEMDKDIRELLQNKMTDKVFEAKYDKGLLELVNDSFKMPLVRLLMDKDPELKKKAQEISNKISLFCAAFM